MYTGNLTIVSACHLLLCTVLTAIYCCFSFICTKWLWILLNALNVNLNINGSGWMPCHLIWPVFRSKIEKDISKFNLHLFLNLIHISLTPFTQLLETIGCIHVLYTYLYTQSCILTCNHASVPLGLQWLAPAHYNLLPGGACLTFGSARHVLQHWTKPKCKADMNTSWHLVWIYKELYSLFHLKYTRIRYEDNYLLFCTFHVFSVCIALLFNTTVLLVCIL